MNLFFILENGVLYSRRGKNLKTLYKETEDYVINNEVFRRILSGCFSNEAITIAEDTLQWQSAS
jgi:hypothetical protein